MSDDLELEEYDDLDEEEAFAQMERDDDATDRFLDRMFTFLHRIESQRMANPGGCWEWPGAITSTTGYGRVNVGARQIDTHRYAWELLRGQIPADREVCHHCDNRRCINPAHLFLGTRSDNMRDARNKGRITGQKLQLGQIEPIRAAAASGETRTSIAARYGVSRSTITNVVNRTTWTDA